MGFLMGAYGKLMAGQRMRSIQFQLTTVQSRLRRITREIGDKEKMYQSQERNMKTMMQAQMRNSTLQGLKNLANTNPELAGIAGLYGENMLFGNGVANAQTTKFDTATMTAFSTAYANIQQEAQMQYMLSNNMWQETFEMQKTADLQALKDVEEDLQIEKDNLESQLKIAQADYEANKEMEKQGAQNLKPDYTGQA